MDFSNIDEGHLDEEEAGAEEERLVFYYDRSKRVKNAPQIVQDYYSGKFTAFRPGLFKALVATKANRFILFTLVVCFLMVLFVGFFGPKDNVCVIRGVKADLSAFVYEDFGEKVYVDLKLDPPSKQFLGEYEEPLPVKITFSAVNNDLQVIEKIVVEQTYSGKELYEKHAENFSKVKEAKKKDKRKSVKVDEVYFDAKTSFSDYDIVSISAEVELNGETKIVSSPVKNLTSLIR